MRTLVTGATGLLGANVVRELESRDRKVRVIVRHHSSLAALQGTHVEVVYGDVLDPVSLHQAVRNCDTVIHAAANTSQWPVNYPFYEPVNVTGTRNVMSACRDEGISKIVYVGTANSFGPGTKENPGTELSEFSGFRTGSGYVISKYVAQQHVLSEVEKNGLPAVVVNPTFMIGPWDVKPSSGRIIQMYLAKKIQCFPTGGKNFIDVRDAATGVCNALERGKPGECYLLANENLTYREFITLVNHVAGQQAFKIKIPSVPIRVSGLLGTLAEKVSGKPAPLNKVNARLLTLGNYYSARKAVTELELPQNPVENAIREAIRWFGNHSGM